MIIDTECKEFVTGHPKLFVEPIFQFFRLAIKLARRLFVIEPPQDFGEGCFGGVDKTLHFAGAERNFDLRTIGIDDGIVRIFPSLILYTLRGPGFIAIESRRIERVSVSPLDRIDGGIDVRPKLVEVSRPVPKLRDYDRIEKAARYGTEVEAQRAKI